jgi:predicted PolB exonuclease-like 3'-5' exonuclease
LIEALQKKAENSRKEYTGSEFIEEYEANARAFATLLSVATKYFGKVQKIEAEIDKELRAVDKFIKVNTEALEAKEA